MNAPVHDGLHPAGEAVFTFPPYGGNVRLCPTADALPPCGGLVPWAAFQKQCGLIDALAASVPEAQGAARVAGVAQRLWSALPSKLILDWDSTVQTKYGRQEGAAVGYNRQKRGRKSFHPLLAAAAGRPHYLFRLKLPANVKRAIAAVPDAEWQGPARLGVLQVAEVSLRLPDWSCARRVVVGRRCLGEVSHEVAGTFWDEAQHEFEACVTSLPMGEANAWQVIELYRQRADTENVFDELRHQWGLEGFCCRKRPATARAARLGLRFDNLWHLCLRLLEPGRHVESAGGRRWFLLIAARLVQSGRQKTLPIRVSGKGWEPLRAGYERGCAWLAATAPQLKSEALTVPLPPPIGVAPP